MSTVIQQTAAHLLGLHGVGNYTAAQLLITGGANPDPLRNEASFAALCGTAPVPASSGKTTRHRLSRGRDRRANHALPTIALVRMRSHPPTKAFVQQSRLLTVVSVEPGAHQGSGLVGALHPLTGRC